MVVEKLFILDLQKVCFFSLQSTCFQIFSPRKRFETGHGSIARKGNLKGLNLNLLRAKSFEKICDYGKIAIMLNFLCFFVDGRFHMTFKYEAGFSNSFQIA